MAQELEKLNPMGANYHHHHHHHVMNTSSSNPNNTTNTNTTSFETNPLEVFNFDPQPNSVSQPNSGLFWKNPNSPLSSSSSKPMITDSSMPDFYHFDESTLQRCVFSFEPNERPSQGLSLSLSSTNPSTIGIQPFEVVRPQEQAHHHNQGYFGKFMNVQGHNHEELMGNQDGYLGKQGNMIGGYNLRSSRYLVSTQELLSEFCSLGSKQSDYDSRKSKGNTTSSNQWQENESLNASSSQIKSLSSLEILELQKRKTKLLQMLEEVDRRYKHYCDQMKAVVSSFEAIAGNGSAKVYSTLASKAMSRHFRSLRDGIIGQIKITKNSMGEKDISTPGMTKGETPRLKLLDQTLRQQKAFQQMTMMDSHPWRPQRGLPERSVSILRAWLFEHFLHPYPSDVDKHILARQTGLSRSQVSNWFINARVRLWKPMVEEMYMEETKANPESLEGRISIDDGLNTILDPSQSSNLQTDKKPTPEQLVRIDSECLSSIINHHPERTDHHGFPRVSSSFGAVELDFSSYDNHHQHHFGGGGAGVSLTLGLQQHGGSGGSGGGAAAAGMGLGFSHAAQNSLFYPRDHMEDCQTAVQYSSLLEGDQGQNLPYRNLMGAQLLHDLAG